MITRESTRLSGVAGGVPASARTRSGKEDGGWKKPSGREKRPNRGCSSSALRTASETGRGYWENPGATQCSTSAQPSKARLGQTLLRQRVEDNEASYEDH